MPGAHSETLSRPTEGRVETNVEKSIPNEEENRCFAAI